MTVIVNFLRVMESIAKIGMGVWFKRLICGIQN